MNKLDVYLRDRGIRRKYFAERVGISQATLHSIIHNKTSPSVRLAWRIQQQTDGHVNLYDWLIEEAIQQEQARHHEEETEDS